MAIPARRRNLAHGGFVRPVPVRPGQL